MAKSTINDIVKVTVGVILAVMLISAYTSYKNKTPAENSTPPVSSESCTPVPKDEEEFFYEGFETGQ